MLHNGTQLSQENYFKFLNFQILESSKKNLDDEQQPRKRRRKKEVSGCSFYNHKKFNEFKEHLLVF